MKVPADDRPDVLSAHKVGPEEVAACVFACKALGCLSIGTLIAFSLHAG